MELWEKKNLTAAVKSPPIICQLFLKNRPLKPSGPAALLSGIEKKAALISSLVIGRLKVVLEGAEIVFGKRRCISSTNWPWSVDKRF